MSNNILTQLSALKLIPVVVLNDAEKAVPLAKTLLESGCNSIEITFRTEAAEESIARIAREVPGMIVGAGTLLTPEEIHRAHQAGASFGVAPGFDPVVVEAARECGFTFVPGVATATEISQALTMGCRVLKFFPAQAAGGTVMVNALMDAFRHTGVKLMATGGINKDNIGSWLSVPEVIACGGSWICKGDLIEAENWGEIARLTKEALADIR